MDSPWQRNDFGRFGENVYLLSGAATAPRWGVGRFDLRAGHAAWRTDNRIGGDGLVAFANRGVEILQEGRPRALANGNVAMFYDPHTVYRRRLVDPYGDQCTHLSLPWDRWHAIAAEVDPAFDGHTLFSYARGPARAEVRLRFEVLLRSVEAGGYDPLAIEEALLELAYVLVRDAVGRERGRPDGPTERRHREQVRAMEAFLSLHYRRSDALDVIAASAELSAFHAARLFRRHTGTTLHAYRDELRVRAALVPLAEGHRIDELALSLGFSSHAHFTDRFRRRFGVAPSALRRALAPASDVRAGS